MQSITCPQSIVCLKQCRMAHKETNEIEKKMGMCLVFFEEVLRAEGYEDFGG